MAKAAALIKEDPKDLVPRTPAGVPSFLAARVHEDAGKGVSNDASDRIVPLIYLLQSGSPQVKARHPDYISGANEGDIWLRNSGLPPISGDDGIICQSCFFWKCWNEWGVPRGTGFFGSHADLPADAKEVEVPDPERPGQTRKMWMLDNGHQVVETRNHAVIVYLPSGQAFQYCLPFSSTGHTVSKTWMNMLASKKVGGDPAPSWACLYKLTTKSKTKNDQTWNIFDVQDAGWVETQAQYDAGRELYEAFASGEKQAAVEETIDPEFHAGDDSAM